MGHKGPPPVDREPKQPWVERFVLPFVEDSSLWPVLAAIIGHVAVLMAMPMINVWRDGDLVSAGALIVLAVGPCGAVMQWEWKKERKPGPLTWTILITWGTALVMAYVADRFGVY